MTTIKNIQGIDGLAPASPRRQPADQPTGFDHALERLLDVPTKHDESASEPVGEGIRFSKHAEARLNSRGLTVTDTDREQLTRAIDELERRGAKKSLVLTGDRAWVVGVPKKTVITVMSRDEALGQIFTDLDSTFVAA